MTPTKSLNLNFKIKQIGPGDQVLVKFIRDGKLKESMATLRNSSGTTEIVEVSTDFESEGAVFEDVSEELAEILEIDGGVQVSHLSHGKWRDAGLREGFIITRIDKQHIRELDDLRNFLQRPGTDGILIEGIYPNGDKAYYGLGL